MEPYPDKLTRELIKAFSELQTEEEITGFLKRITVQPLQIMKYISV